MIGLIFGETSFPKEVLKKIKKKRLKYLIIDLSKKKIFKNDNRSHTVSMGQFGKIIDILKKNKCKKVLFAGKVKKPKFNKIKLDFKGLYYMPRIIKSAKLGDAAILDEVVNIFKKEGIHTIDSLTFNPDLSLKKGNHSKVRPNINDSLDVKKAVKTMKKLNDYSHTQGAIVRNNKLLATEGIKGTQEMLKKVKPEDSENSGVLIKYPKKKQNLKIDLPTIGFETVLACKSAGIKGIVLKSKKNIFLDKRKCIRFVNKNKMFILVK